MRRGYRLVRWVAVAAVVIVTAACGGEEKPTMQRSEAEQRVERYIQEAAGQISPAPRLEISSKNEIPCGDGGSDGDVYAVEHSYWVREVPPADNSRVIDGLKTYWTSNGYTLRKTETAPGGAPTSVSANRDADDFYVRIWQNPAGDLILVSSSTCVQDA